MSNVAWLLPVALFALPAAASAHCPLCTAGAGLAAIGASYLGLSSASIGVFIGAFSIAMGLWFNNLLKKKYVPYQAAILAGLSFATTVIPLLPMLSRYSSIYISYAGDYGSWLNRTYLINTFLIGSIVGGVLMAVSPKLSKKLTAVRNGVTFPYQGMAVTFTVLVVSAAIAQVLVMI